VVVNEGERNCNDKGKKYYYLIGMTEKR